MPTEQMIESLKEWCEKRPIRLCVLFSAQFTSKIRLQEQLNLAIWPSEHLSAKVRRRWLLELQNLSEKEVSLIVVSADLDPMLGIEIVQNDHLIFEREPDLWLRYRLQIWHTYHTSYKSIPFQRQLRLKLRDVPFEEISATLQRKLAYLRQVLADLIPYQDTALTKVKIERYKLERLLELTVVITCDILFHKLVEPGQMPMIRTHIFDLAAQKGLISIDLANRLANIAQLNQDIHYLYDSFYLDEDWSYSFLRENIKLAIQDFSQFIAIFEKQPNDN